MLRACDARIASSPSNSGVVPLWMPQECYQIVQSMAYNTTLHQVGIVGEVKGVNPPVLGYKFCTELYHSTSRAGIGHKEVGCQRGHKTVSVLG